MWCDVLCALGAAVIAAIVGWPVTGWVLRGAARERKVDRSKPGTTALWTPDGGQSDDDAHESPAEPPAEQPASAARAPGQDAPVDTAGVLRGGLAIGLLERFLVAGGIAVGQPAILAVVVAVKGLGRIPELRVSRAAGERFIIGTFASLTVAGIIGYVGHVLSGIV